MRQVKIGDKWTFGDWGAYLGMNPTIGTPEVKTSFVDLPAGNGSIDLTEALTNEPVYKDRTIEFELLLFPPRIQWEHTRTKIANYCHGRRLPIVMPDDPEHYFIGRIEMEDMKKEKSETTATIKFKVVCEPFRYKNNKTIFKQVIPSTGVLKLNLKNERKRVLPTFTTGGETTIEFNGLSYTTSSGTFKLTNVSLSQGDNPITIKGNAGTSVLIEYQEGAI